MMLAGKPRLVKHPCVLAFSICLLLAGTTSVPTLKGGYGNDYDIPAAQMEKCLFSFLFVYLSKFKYYRHVQRSCSVAPPRKFSTYRA